MHRQLSAKTNLPLHKDPLRTTTTTFDRGWRNDIERHEFIHTREGAVPRRPVTEGSSKRLTLHSQYQKIQDRLLFRQETSSQRRVYSKGFLQRGASVNRSILLNVLKTKIRGSICGSHHSYTATPINRKLGEAIRKQIPGGLRDIVGVEQMIRMSHIFTGGNFQSVNLIQRVKEEAQFPPEKEEKQDKRHSALKSINRW